MDNVYLQELITRIEYELSVHDKKYSGSWIHSQCPGRMRKVILALKKALNENRMQQNKTSKVGAETFRGDELEPAKKLFQVAHLKEEVGEKEEAEEARDDAWNFVAKQLNEFDGFNR